ncbi:MAG: polysaccharide biosynthesis tyrosine autokinase [Pseudomonadota bacterium]
MRHDTVISDLPAPLPAPSGGKSQQIDIQGLIQAAIRRMWVPMVFAGVFACIGVFIAQQQQPVYSSGGKIYFSQDQVNVVDAPVLQDGGIRRDTMSNYNQLILSEGSLRPVVLSLGLQEVPGYGLEPVRLNDIDRARLWLGDQIDALKAELAARGWMALPEEEVELLSPEEEAEIAILSAIATLRDQVTFASPSTRTLRIIVTTPDPFISASAANAIIDRFLEMERSAYLGAAERATEWLVEQTAEYESRVQAAEAAVDSARRELLSLAGQSAQMTDRQINSLNASLADERARLPRLRADIERARALLEEDSDFGGFTAFRNSGEMQSLRRRLDELQARRTSLLEDVAEDHPAVRAVNAQISEWRSVLRSEAERIAAALANDLSAAESTVAELQLRLQELEAAGIEQTSAEVNVRQLERKAQAARAAYQSLLSRLQETSSQQSLYTAGARVIAEARPPVSPDGGKKLFIVGGAVVAGGGLGLALVLLLELATSVFRTPKELERLTGLPVLGVLPSIKGGKSRATMLDVLNMKRGWVLRESVRDFRTGLLHSLLAAPPKVVTVTSAVPGEGKSTTAMMLAYGSASMGESTIIVECDFRRPGIAQLYELQEDAPGVLSVLNGEATLEEAVFEDESSGAHLLLMQPNETLNDGNPGDMLSSRRLRRLIETLRGHYDLVVIDAPPLLAVTDARLLATHSDAVVMVVRWSQTKRSAVNEAIGQLTRTGISRIGLCMVAMDAKAAKRCGAGPSLYSGAYASNYC